MNRVDMKFIIQTGTPWRVKGTLLIMLDSRCESRWFWGKSEHIKDLITTITMLFLRVH